MKHRAAVLSFCIMLSGMIIGLGEIAFRFDLKHEEFLLQSSLYESGTLIAQEIQRNIYSCIYVTDILASKLRQDDYGTENFEAWGREIIEANGRINCVQLAPGGVVSFIYPLAGNEAAVGHDLLKDRSRNDGARMAITSRELTVIGPVTLIQNGETAIIARKPVFRPDTDGFWGFSIALIYINDIIPEILKSDDRQMGYRLSGFDPDADEAPVFFQSGDTGVEDKISVQIDVPNGQWLLEIFHQPIKNAHYLYIRLVLHFLAVMLSAYIYIQQTRIKNKINEIRELNSELREMSMVDELTGLGNRRYTMEVLKNYISQSKRYGTSLSLLMIDLDYFKDVNDTYGHQTGDELLKHFARILLSTIRESDTAVRFAGDEFIVMIPRGDLDDAEVVASKIINCARETPMKFAAADLSVSLSIGIAEWRDGFSIEDLIHETDLKLYKAKNGGRGRYAT